MGEKYFFKQPLQEAVIIKRNSQFTIDVMLNGKEIRCHCPTTTRIGDIDLSGVACLLSHNDDIKRKLKYTVEAISCDDLCKKDKKWIGINLIFSNKIVDFLLQTHQLDKMVNNYTTIHKEVVLGKSKLDFLVRNTYIEVKTPLISLDVNYSSHIKTKKISDFSSTDRFEKHIKELANSLKQHEKAILLTINQYIPDYTIIKIKGHLKSKNYTIIKQVVTDAIDKGVEFWNLQLNFQPDGVELFDLRNNTQEVINY